MKLSEFKSYYYNKKKFNRNKFESKLSTIKSADYSNYYNNKKRIYTTPMSLVKPFKALGPDPLPARPLRLKTEDFNQRRNYYKNDDDDEYFDVNRDPEATFILNDFLIKYKYEQRQRSGLPHGNISEKSQISTHNYKQICQLLSSRLTKDSYCQEPKLNVQTLVPDIETFTNRKPIYQEMIEIAHNLKQDIAHSIFFN
jgi:hypothetical protein